MPNAIGTGGHAVTASDTPVRIDINDPVGPLDRSFNRTNCHADGFCAVIADNGEEMFLRMFTEFQEAKVIPA